MNAHSRRRHTRQSNEYILEQEPGALANFAFGYAALVNFLTFCGLVALTIWMSVQSTSLPDANPLMLFLFLGFGTFVATTLMALIPLFAPMLSIIAIGSVLMRIGGPFFEAIGFAVIGLSGLFLWLSLKTQSDSLRARYWRSMWSNRSSLEQRMNISVAPYSTPTGSWSWLQFYAPVLAPLYLFAATLSEPPTAKSPPKARNDPSPPAVEPPEPPPPSDPAPTLPAQRNQFSAYAASFRARYLSDPDFAAHTSNASVSSMEDDLAAPRLITPPSKPIVGDNASAPIPPEGLSTMGTAAPVQFAHPSTPDDPKDAAAPPEVDPTTTSARIAFLCSYAQEHFPADATILCDRFNGTSGTLKPTLYEAYAEAFRAYNRWVAERVQHRPNPYDESNLSPAVIEARLARRRGTSRRTVEAEATRRKADVVALIEQETLQLLQRLDRAAYEEFRYHRPEGGISYESYKSYKAAQHMLREQVPTDRESLQTIAGKKAYILDFYRTHRLADYLDIREVLEQKKDFLRLRAEAYPVFRAAHDAYEQALKNLSESPSDEADTMITDIAPAASIAQPAPPKQKAKGRRAAYTEPEIVLCTYIARFGRAAFDEQRVSQLEGRSIASIKMKVQNIAAMLQEHGLPYSTEVATLSGLPTGQKGRLTHWSIVSSLAKLTQTELKQRCLAILSR